VGSLLAVSLAAEAQTTKSLRIGFLGIFPTNIREEALLQGLHEFGDVEGKNITIERRYFEGMPERLPDLATQLVNLKVDVIVVDACGAPLNAASQATSTIPIVVAACNDDLVATGLISSLARPGGNITGLSELTPELGAKRLGLLKEAIPKARRVAILWNPAYSGRSSVNFRFWSSDWVEVRAAAQVLDMTVQSVEIRGANFDTAFSAMTGARADAMIAFSDPLIVYHGRRIAFLAAKSRLLVKKGSGIKSLADVAGKRVGAIRGTTGEQALRASQPKANVVTFQDVLAAFLALEQERVVAYAHDGILLAGLAPRTRNPKDYEVVGDFFSRDPYSCMVPENDSKWRDFVNHTFMELIDSGKFFELYDKWFGERGVVPYPMSDKVRNYMIMQSMPE
jgi:ABC-type amino acid transport substrate-binding protein